MLPRGKGQACSPSVVGHDNGRVPEQSMLFAVDAVLLSKLKYYIHTLNLTELAVAATPVPIHVQSNPQPPVQHPRNFASPSSIKILLELLPFEIVKHVVKIRDLPRFGGHYRRRGWAGRPRALSVDVVGAASARRDIGVISASLSITGSSLPLGSANPRHGRTQPVP